jgi:hypothetical protein
MNWGLRLKRWVVPTPRAAAALPRVEPGLYHYQRQREGGYLRFHLRVDPRGEGLLIAAAAEVLRLSPAGVAAAKGLLEGTPPDDVAARLPASNAAELVATVDELLDDLGRDSGRFPILNPADPALTAGTEDLLAPFRADVVSGPADRTCELLARLWNEAVPHARLISRAQFDLPSLLIACERAEDLGMIAGLTADARDLHQADRLDQLAGVGLDYVVVPWGVTDDLHATIYGPTDEGAVADLVRRIHGLEMTPVLEIPLTDETDDALEENVGQLDRWHVADVEAFAVVCDRSGDEPADAAREADLHAYAPAELPQIAAWTEDLAQAANLRLVWLPPLACAPGESVDRMARRGVRAGGDVTIRVEADGTVIPPHGPYAAAGNLLTDAWPKIWQHETFERLRKQAGELSAAPSDPAGWQYPAP